MHKYESLNEFKEGQVCPTHDCFAVWDTVWVMINNKPTEVRIVEVKIQGFYRCGWQSFGPKKELAVSYKVNKELNRYDYSGGDYVNPKLLFPTKLALIESIK